jgi:hypothetical protein
MGREGRGGEERKGKLDKKHTACCFTGGLRWVQSGEL